MILFLLCVLVVGHSVYRFGLNLFFKLQSCQLFNPIFRNILEGFDVRLRLDIGSFAFLAESSNNIGIKVTSGGSGFFAEDALIVGEFASIFVHGYYIVDRRIRFEGGRKDRCRRIRTLFSFSNIFSVNCEFGVFF